MSASPLQPIRNDNIVIYTCSTSVIDKIINFLLICTTAAVLFLLLSLPSVDHWMSCSIPNFYYRLLIKALIIFVVMYILDRILEYWRIDRVVCNSPADQTLQRFFRNHQIET